MVSPDRSVGASPLAVAVGVDEEVGESVFVTRDITEGWGLSQLLAELDSVSEVAVHLFGVLGGTRSGFAGLLESSAEVRLEQASSGRRSSFQGLGCG